MGIARALERFRNRKHRRAYRAMVGRWYADGGDERFRFDYDLDRESLVLDVGGYEGQWASDLYARRPCRIQVFEPVTQYAERIRTRFRHNPDIDVFDVALGGNERDETIRIIGASSSTHKARKSEEQTMRIVDVKEWFDEHGIEHVDLIKINTEGGEFELLERMIEAGLVPRLRDIQVQFHNVADDSTPRMEMIQREFARTHELTYQYRYVWENWSRKADVANPGPADA
jgi:FkbM family methyltransferase